MYIDAVLMGGYLILSSAQVNQIMEPSMIDGWYTY